MKATIENLSHVLTFDEANAVMVASNFNFSSIDNAVDELKAWFPDWFVYRGGHHVALHRNNKSDRVLLITE